MSRIAVVEREKFNPEETELMIALCPVNRKGEECITKAEDAKIDIDEKLCIGCGICVNRASNESIHIVNLPEELDKPIHRYGQNGFHLFNLPVPKMGQVVGILGRNGIGKSTALNILAGILKPNLGKEESSYDELIEFFKGSEAQKFFEKVKEGSIKIGYKPQQVDAIPKSATGSVKELLEKTDEKGKIDEIAKDSGP